MKLLTLFVHQKFVSETREVVSGQIENDVWTNTLWHTPKKFSHRCMSPSHFDVSKHFDVDNYVRSRDSFLLNPVDEMSLMDDGMRVSHCERNRACIICQKI